MRHKECCKTFGTPGIRDHRGKTNQNMYEKVRNKFCSNFALAAPYNPPILTFFGYIIRVHDSTYPLILSCSGI